MRSAMNACRILARSGKILLDEMIWWLCGPTARPVARGVVYVYVDPLDGP